MPADDQHIRLRNCLYAVHQALLIERLLIQHNIRLDDAAAGASRNTVTGFHVLGIIEFAAVLAVISMHRAVQLVDVLATGSLMQTVYILRDNGGQLACLLQLCELFVCGVWLRVQREHLVLIKSEELLRLRLEKGMTEDGFRRKFVLLMIQAVNAAEIRNAAFRRDTGAAEKNKFLGSCAVTFEFAVPMPWYCLLVLCVTAPKLWCLLFARE